MLTDVIYGLAYSISNLYMAQSVRVQQKANWIGHILCRNCLLQRVIEGMIKGGVEVTGRREENVGSYWMTLTFWLRYYFFKF